MDNEQYPLMNAQVTEKLIAAGIAIESYQYDAGELIMKKGSISDKVFIITAGEVLVYIEQEVKIQLAVLKHGQFFGEMSCLTGDTVSANVEAIGEVHVQAIGKAGLLLLMDEHSHFRMQMINAMVKRIQSSNERVVEEHEKSVLMIKQQEGRDEERYGDIIGESEAMRAVIDQVHAAAAHSKPVIICGEPGTGKMNVAAKLHYLAAGGLYPLLTIEPDKLNQSEWDAKLRAARGGSLVISEAEKLSREWLHAIDGIDGETRIILLSSVQLPLQRAQLIAIPPLRERVEDIPLLANYFAIREGAAHAENAISQDALRMLSLYPYLHNNVEELQAIIKEASIRSEGKMITSGHLRFGRSRAAGERPKIGLALGSGSLRGLAHVGVLRVLQQENIPIDYIAGTSVGSFIGGAFAAGMSADDIAAVVATMRWGHLVRPTFPKRSFVHNTPMVDFIESRLGKRNIEDLPIPFAAVASEVATGEAHIMTSGSLAHAISASTAIPAVMRPVHFQNKTLIDGAVVHPVPAALVKSMGADIVIAVNVSAESFAKGTTRHFVDSLMNIIDMMSAKMVREELQLADIILRPDLGFQQIGFKDMNFCFSAGELVTRQSVEQIRQLLDQTS